MRLIRVGIMLAVMNGACVVAAGGADPAPKNAVDQVAAWSLRVAEKASIPIRERLPKEAADRLEELKRFDADWYVGPDGAFYWTTFGRARPDDLVKSTTIGRLDIRAEKAGAPGPFQFPGLLGYRVLTMYVGTGNGDMYALACNDSHSISGKARRLENPPSEGPYWMVIKYNFLGTVVWTRDLMRDIKSLPETSRFGGRVGARVAVAYPASFRILPTADPSRLCLSYTNMDEGVRPTASIIFRTEDGAAVLVEEGVRCPTGVFAAQTTGENGAYRFGRLTRDDGVTGEIFSWQRSDTGWLHMDTVKGCLLAQYLRVPAGGKESDFRSAEAESYLADSKTQRSLGRLPIPLKAAGDKLYHLDRTKLILRVWGVSIAKE